MRSDNEAKYPRITSGGFTLDENRYKSEYVYKYPLDDSYRHEVTS